MIGYWLHSHSEWTAKWSKMTWPQTIARAQNNNWRAKWAPVRRWMENFVLPRMPVYGAYMCVVCIYIYMRCVYIYIYVVCIYIYICGVYIYVWCIYICGVYIYVYIYGVYIYIYIWCIYIYIYMVYIYIYIWCIYIYMWCIYIYIWYIYIYICVCVCHMFITHESAQKILQTQLKKGNGHLGKPSIYTRFVNDEENSCRFEGQGKETWIYTRPAWSITVRERTLEFYSD